MDRAFDYGSKGCRFDSCRARDKIWSNHESVWAMGSDMVDRLQRSRFVAQVVASVESHLCDTQHDGAQQLRILTEQGALRYWLLNFSDFVASQWELCESLSLAEQQEIQTKSPLTAGSGSLPLLRMTDLLEASQTDQWASRLRFDILEYWHNFGHQALNEQSAPISVSISPKIGAKTAQTSKRIVLSRTYLSRFQEVLLAALCRTVPLRWAEPELVNNVDHDLREQLRFIRQDDEHGSLDHCIRVLLPNYLPQSLLEHFSQILKFGNNRVKEVPAVIFTANLHVGSDSFLIWATYKRLEGSKFVCSQHGGLNGQGLVPTRGEEFEQTFPDRFLHWGWGHSDKSTRIPAQLLVGSTSRRKRSNHNELLMITDCTFRNSRKSWSSVEDDRMYREMLLDSYSRIPPHIQKSTIIRLHHDHDKYDSSHREMWESAHPHAQIDDGKNSIEPLQRRARLVMCTTLGTSEIVQFGKSIPTILRLHPEVHAVRGSCADLFQMMEEQNLVHYSSESVQMFLEKFWDNLDSWWTSDGVQNVRSDYLERFGYRSSRPLREIRDVLLAIRSTG